MIKLEGVAGMAHGYLHIVAIGFLAIFTITLAPEALGEHVFAAAASQGFVVGDWGGDHVSLVAQPRSSAMLEFDCAHGWTKEPIKLGQNGHFSAPGWYVQEFPGPISLQHPPQPQLAVYSGEVKGNKMTLTVTVTPLMLQKDTGKVLGIFNLIRGMPAHIFKCL